MILAQVYGRIGAGGTLSREQKYIYHFADIYGYNKFIIYNMATIAYFLTPTQIKATAYIDENTDDKYLINAIRIAQDLYILPILGSGIYDEIKTQINAGTVTALNDTLLKDYIQHSLTFFTLYEAIEPLSMKFTNKSILKKTSENSQPISFEEMNQLKEKFKNIAEYYANRIVKYLIENEASYPLYYNPGSAVDTVHPKRNVFDSGWNLDRITREQGGDCSKIDYYENPGTCCD